MTSNPTSGDLSEEIQNTNLKRHMIYIHMFIAALFTVAKIWKQTKCPLIHERIKRMWHMYTMKYYLAMSEDFLLQLGRGATGV